jgi:hypothetical protein
MKNLVKCVVGFFALFGAKKQMLRWVKKGGGGRL